MIYYNEMTYPNIIIALQVYAFIIILKSGSTAVRATKWQCVILHVNLNF